ncbi:aflatoxin b1-aldehyde reductase [Grosmannia clavigera kw1407]|uniref:Aflatoxin b1-aldehyde reductase n=1 Tax=Grosmannia clavigera (strain kw1407 / UAMH 11150) TaxID=655863 RepID=F0XK86_GROCL|nr:aflatoxin b1-aldehyde reductase [Grosmannia clavigera kw1407]EFX02012.1 aflatoxin b1-aldehyde reductase [Grosmannia clavigera kw1407]
MAATAATTQPKTALKIVFGAMTLGREGVEQTRVHSLQGAAAILDTFQKHGYNEVDTARVYGDGSSEEYLGQLDLAKRGIVLATKLAPGTIASMAHAYTHRPAELRAALLDSLRALQTDRVDMWYLHMPDHSVPYEDTLREVDSLHRQGYFRRFGLSNYAAWEVAQIAETAIRHGWKRPDVYQGVYNGPHRAVEPELLPALRHYGIAFYLYNPLAGGLLTDRYRREQPGSSSDAAIDPGSRFDPTKNQGASYRDRYWNDAYFDALDVVRPVAARLGIPTAEAALRWASHHSLLAREHGDAIIIGASSQAQLEQNLTALEQGPLPVELVEAFDKAWLLVKAVARPYFR